MDFVLLTQYSGKILGPIAKFILGPILNGIYNLLYLIKIPNIGLAIILFTIVIYLLMLPLTIKQQKFSKLQAKMQPEIQAIQEKYKNRKDQDSQMAMSQETSAVYAKYGVSPTGSCLQLLIQMPILFALYRVIYAIPAYVPKVKDLFNNVVDALYVKEGATEKIKELSSFVYVDKNVKPLFDAAVTGDNVDKLKNGFIDVLNRASNAEWEGLKVTFPDLSGIITDTMTNLDKINNFLGVNVGYSPKETISNAVHSKSYFVILVAILIPVLSAVTQWINVKLTPQASNNNNKSTGNTQADQMQSSMKAMNTFMPIFSAVMCFTLPAGMGIYWIAGSVVRSIQQVLINKYIDKMDMDAEIKKNIEKRDAKLRKAGIDPSKVTSTASMSTKSIASKANSSASRTTSAEDVSKSTEYYNKNAAKPGSIAAKANMVKQYNEKNNNN